MFTSKGIKESLFGSQVLANIVQHSRKNSVKDLRYDLMSSLTSVLREVNASQNVYAIVIRLLEIQRTGLNGYGRS